jgi:hypothetical protein
MAAVEANDAEANITAAIRDFFMSYLAKNSRVLQPGFKNRGGQSYQSTRKSLRKLPMCALLRGNMQDGNTFQSDALFTRFS